MKDEKQIIEEMAKVLSTVKRCDAFVVSECIKRKCEYPHFNGVTCIAEHQAKALYDAGYRRQTKGEWLEKGDTFYVFAKEIADFIYDGEIEGLNIEMNGRYLGKNDFIKEFTTPKGGTE